MIEFRLTETDQHLLDLQREENEIAAKYAREQEAREDEHPRMHGVLPDAEGREFSDEALARLADETSGNYIIEALMMMEGATDGALKDNPHEAFGSDLFKQFASDEQLEEYGHLLLSIGLSEPGAGSDPLSMRSTARYDPETDEYVLNGEKTFISFINKFDGALTLVKEIVEGQKHPNLTAFVVLKETAGFTETSQMKKLGINKHDIGGFSMQDVRVPASAKLDIDFAKTMSRFNHNRPLIVAIALGSCRSMLDFTAEKLLGRAPDFASNVRNRSAVEDRLIRLEAIWEASYHAVLNAKVREQAVGLKSYAYRNEASMAKAMGGTTSRIITQACLELLGPAGLSTAHLAEKWFRDVRIADIYEGAGEVQRIMIARALFDYKHELN